MVKFTKTSQVAEACLDSMKRNHLCTKIGSKKYEKVIRKVKAGLKRGSMKCIWKHFIKQYFSTRACLLFGTCAMAEDISQPCIGFYTY